MIQIICPNLPQICWKPPAWIALVWFFFFFFFCWQGKYFTCQQSGTFVNKINDHLLCLVLYNFVKWDGTIACLWHIYAAHLIPFLCCNEGNVNGVLYRDSEVLLLLHAYFIWRAWVTFDHPLTILDLICHFSTACPISSWIVLIIPSAPLLHWKLVQCCCFCPQTEEASKTLKRNQPLQNSPKTHGHLGFVFFFLF